MNSTEPKKIEELPQFHVTGIRQLGGRADGHTEFEFAGTFDRLDGVTEGRCSLLLPNREILTALGGQLTLVNANARTAVCLTSDVSVPDLTGVGLAYLAAGWEAYHVWMVVEPRWKWIRTQFHAIHATTGKAEHDVSIVDGQEVREWVEIRKVGEKSSLSRSYPVLPDGRITLSAIGPDGIIKGGWDHEHCELCNAHIDDGSYGYIDLGKHWTCEACYAKYVLNRDLSFIHP